MIFIFIVHLKKILNDIQQVFFDVTQNSNKKKSNLLPDQNILFYFKISTISRYSLVNIINLVNRCLYKILYFDN